MSHVPDKLPRRLRLAVAALLAIFLLGWFASLQHRGLFFPDEGRYAEIPREMLASGDWTTPRLNDLKYFEKPPLQYWLTGLSFAVLGEDEWTARLPGALLGFLAVLMVAFTATRLWDARAGLLAGTILGSSWAFYLSGQILTLDMTLSSFLTLVLCSILLAQRDDATESEYRRWMLVAWVAAGCAVLSKGLIGVVLPGLTIAAYSIVARDRRIWARLNVIPGFALFAVIVLPWFVLVQWHNPEFFDFFFIREHFQRFAEAGHGRPGAWWYYLPILAIGFMPWTPLLISQLQGRRRAIRDHPALSHSRFRIDWFCLAWAATILLFFSVSSSKLPLYIVPVLPALALWSCRLPDAERISALVICAGCVIVVGIALLIAMPHLPRWSKFAAIGPDAIDALPILYGAAIVLSLGGVAAAWFLVRSRPLWGVASLSAATFAFWACVFAFLHHVDAHFSSERLIEGITRGEARPFNSDLAFYSVGQFDHSLPFYLGRPVTLVANFGELAPGVNSEPQKVLSSISSFQEVWRDTPDQAFAAMTPRQHKEFERANLPMVKVAGDARLIVVSRRP